MTIEGDPRRNGLPTAPEHGAVGQASALRPTPYVGNASPYRDFWGWVQIVGLGLLAAGVAVLVAFALTVGGR